MIQYAVFILAILLIPMATAVKPQASYIGDTLFVPRSTDGDKHHLGEANADFFFRDENDTIGFRIWEYDTDADLMLRYVNNRTLGVKATSLSMTDIPIEICFLEDVELDIPGLKKRDFKTPVNCPGQTSLFYTMNNNTEYTFMFKNEIQPYRFYLGEGAGGGPGIGCTISCSPCYSIGITSGSTPSSTNTETNFNHQAVVSMNICAPVCQCPLNYYHRPFSSYTSYTSSYPSSFLNSVAKLISGSASRIITTGGSYTNTLKCGGTDGNLYLRATVPGNTGLLTTDKTVACNDVSGPTATLWTPPNATDYDQPLINITCNVTDNTGLDYTYLYDNRTGSWGLRDTYTHGNLDYSRTVTFSQNYSGYESTEIYYNCTAVDTGANRGYSALRWFNYTEPPFFDEQAPDIVWVYPTPDNESEIDQDWVYLNASINDSSFMSAFFDWNHTLSGYWSFDTENSVTVYDDSDNGNNGTYTGGMSSSNIEQGIRGDGIRFDGSNDYISLGEQIKSNVGTYGGWFYFDSLTCSGGYCIPMQQSDSGDTGWEIYTYSGRVYCWDGATSSPPLGPPITAGSWYHIACMHTGTEFSMWMNGSKWSNSVASTRSTSSSEMVVGGQNYASYGYYTGLADEIFVFDRVLSSDEMASLANHSNGTLEANFTSLGYGTYYYRAFSIDEGGYMNKTGMRNVILTPISETMVGLMAGTALLSGLLVLGLLRKKKDEEDEDGGQ